MLPPMTRVAFILAAAALAFATSSASAACPTARGDPGAFVAGVVSDIAHNDYERAWQSLHPAHKRVAPVAEYVRCELLSPMLGELQSITVLDVSDRRVQLVPRARPVLAKAVTVRLVLSEPTLGQTQLTHTAHAVPVGARWAWILPRARYLLYRSDRCA